MSDAQPIDTTTDTAEDIELEEILAEHKIPRERVEELRAKFPKLFVLRDLPVIFRIPRAEEFDRTQRKKEQFSALQDLVRRHVVYPEAEAYERLCAEFPLAFATIGDAMADIARNKKQAEAKKL